MDPTIIPPQSDNSVPPVNGSESASKMQKPSGGIISGEFTSPSNVAPNKPKSRKKLFTFGLVGVVIILLIGGFVFGYYLPNQPARVWVTGVNRSGKALNAVVGNVTEKSKLEDFKKSDITASVEAKYGEATYKGTFNVKFDSSKSEGGLEITAKDNAQANAVFSAKFLSEVPKGSQYPNIYFQLSGLKAFGLDNFLPYIADYDGKWIAIEANYLKSLGNVPTAEETAKKKLTSDDIAELAKAVTDATIDYVFTTDGKKAVFEKKSFVGKEKIEGLNTYHYTVGLNKAHLKDYCKALVSNTYSTAAYKKIQWVDEDNADEDKKAALKNCEESSFDGIKDSDTYDVWIETKHKLIYKIRIPDSTDKSNYTEIGQIYKGGDDMSLFVVWHNKSDGIDDKFTIDTNIKTAVTKASLYFASDSQNSPYSVKLSLDSKPYSGKIDIKKPANAVPIQELLSKLGIDPSALAGIWGVSSVQSSSKDTEREVDIKALHAQIEAYFAQNGRYPTLANVNDEAWRASNMKGLDKEALKDPDGQNHVLANVPAAKVYSYQVFAQDGKTACNNTTVDCTTYTLTAIRADSSTYSKANLN